MAEIAMAAGFGSVRRFNETFQQLFRRPPASLRRQKSAAAGLGAGVLQLPYRPPYDWDAMLGFLAARAIPGVAAVTLPGPPPGCHARSIRIGHTAASQLCKPATDHALTAPTRSPRTHALPLPTTR